MASFGSERTPQEMLVVALMGMGFAEEIAKQAVLAPGITTVEAAINYIVSLPDDDEDNDDSGEEDEEDFEPMKMVILVRKDLNMTAGKTAAQCCHACLGAYRLSEKVFIQKWEEQGEATICLQVDSDDQLEAILLAAIEAGLVISAQHDAGRTEVAENTRTCAAIGPNRNSVIDTVTRSLRLYK